jgi:hypothetical protein
MAFAPSTVQSVEIGYAVTTLGMVLENERPRGDCTKTANYVR